MHRSLGLWRPRPGSPQPACAVQRKGCIIQLLHPAAVYTVSLNTVTSMSGAADAKLAQWLAGSSESEDTESESSESRRQRGSGAGRGASGRARQ
jgi:hypothetical protein